MKLINIIRQILLIHPEGLTPQQLCAIVKANYRDFYGTESHRRNVEKGHYKDLDHALLAQIYLATHNAKQIIVDKTHKPIRIILDNKIRGSINTSDVENDTVNLERREVIISTHEETTRKPLTPCPNLILEYLGKWEKLESYRLQEASLCLLFNNLCPENKQVEHVLLKVSVLNDFYSTNIYDTYSVAKHILTKDVDIRLEANDYSLVDDIAKISIKGKIKNYYSFASKYCSHHKPTRFPVFDSFVQKMMLHYNSIDRFDEFDKGQLKKYGRFIEIIKRFRSFYKLEKYSLREIDIFLWLAGKECFPRKY